MIADFKNITACGGDCTKCEHFQNQECEVCNKNGGKCVKMWSKGCEICRCCKEHNVLFCGLCMKFPCKWLKNTLTWDKDGIERLKSYADKYIKEKINGQA